MNLLSPTDYNTSPNYRRLWICNGTGAAGTPKWLTRILDSCNGWGIDVAPASNIHDWMYYFGKHWYHKIWADVVYFINIFLLSSFAIFKKPLSRFIGNLVVFPLRITRAILYFIAVLIFGWRPFYFTTTTKTQHKKALNLRKSIFK